MDEAFTYPSIISFSNNKTLDDFRMKGSRLTKHPGDVLSIHRNASRKNQTERD
jgi:hypothetical protein